MCPPYLKKITTDDTVVLDESKFMSRKGQIVKSLTNNEQLDVHNTKKKLTPNQTLNGELLGVQKKKMFRIFNSINEST